MKRSAAESRQTANAEVPAADHIPFGSQVGAGVIKLRHTGDLLVVWKLEGISFETADVDYIHARKEALNSLLLSLGGGNHALWSHKIRRQVRERLNGKYDNAFAKEFEQRYYDGERQLSWPVDDNYLGRFVT